MTSPPGQRNIPPGLAYLMTVSTLLIKQKVELIEVATGFETRNRFTIKNQERQKVFSAEEISGCWNRNCLGPCRPFDMKIMDLSNNEIIHLYRKLRCCCCCCWCCLQVMEVYSPPGTFVGTVEQTCHVLFPRFDVKDVTGETILKIRGPFFTCAFFNHHAKFKVMSIYNGEQIGLLTKQWAGVIREALTDADWFGVSFPVQLDVQVKALLLGACILIDMMYFEDTINDGCI